jgi:ubiquinone/menaquinone biosynthesis C-methylase UbiE
MNTDTKFNTAEVPGLQSYIIRSRQADTSRLSVLAQALKPSTDALLDRSGLQDGMNVVDVACGGGDVTVELARRVGPKGRVLGLDVDPGKLAAATELTQSLGLTNCTFTLADVTESWPLKNADVAYARFILTHLPRPAQFLDRAMQALARHGVLIAEDIDVDGCFWHPRSNAIATLRDLYTQTAHLRGCDPHIGRKLDELFEASGFRMLYSSLIQPYGKSGTAKQAPVMTFHAIADSVVSAGLMEEGALRQLLTEMDAYAARHDTTISMPRIFQAIGQKP